MSQNPASQNPNLQQTLNTLRTTITKKIPFRRGRSGVQSVVLPSPDAIDELGRGVSSDTYDSLSAFTGLSPDEQCRAAAAVILDSCGVSRYAEREFGSLSSESDSIPSGASITSGSLHDAEQQKSMPSAAEQKRTSKIKPATRVKARQLSKTVPVTSDTSEATVSTTNVDDNYLMPVSSVTTSYCYQTSVQFFLHVFNQVVIVRFIKF